MHLEFLPGDAPDADVQFGVPSEQITTELLELCEEFFRQASPIVQLQYCNPTWAKLVHTGADLAQRVTEVVG